MVVDILYVFKKPLQLIEFPLKIAQLLLHMCVFNLKCNHFVIFIQLLTLVLMKLKKN